MRWLPWAAGVSAGGLTYLSLSQQPDPDLAWVKDMFPAVASLAGVFVGFAGTAKSILLAMSSTSEAVQKLKKRQGYGYVVHHFFDTVLLGLLTASLSVAGLAMDWTRATTVSGGFTAIWAGTSVGTVGAVALTTYYLYKLLIVSAEE